MKEWIKDNKNKLITGAIIIIALTAAFFVGGQQNNMPDIPTEQSSAVQSSVNISENSVTEVESFSAIESSTEESISSEVSIQTIEESSQHSLEKSKEEISEKIYSIVSEEAESSVVSVTEKTVSEITTSSFAEETHIIPESSVEPSQAAESSIEESSKVTVTLSKPTVTSKTESSKVSERSVAQISKSEPSKEERPSGEHSCTLTISCATAIANSSLSEKKRTLLPSDGMILNNTELSYSEGESVFDVLKRVCMDNKIHLEFSITPLTGGAYIEGINNLYEFDCGSISGWMYSVNGEFPNVGCSEYILSDGDDIAFLYSCDLGDDIGNHYRG